jgi:PAS domain S-box-containing protein
MEDAVPFDFELQKLKIQHSSKLKILRPLLVLSLLITTIISLFMVSNSQEYEPTHMRVSMRISHNISTAHIWTRECFRGNREHDQQEIDLLFNRAAGYVHVLLNGGEIDGVILRPLASPEQRLVMEGLGTHIEQMKALNLNGLEAGNDLPSLQKIENTHDNLYLAFMDQITDFTGISQPFFQRNHEWFERLQLVLLFAVMGIVLTILWMTKISDKVQAQSWDLVKKIEERRKLAITGAKLGTWDWNIKTGEIVINERWAEMIGLDPQEIELNVSTWEKLVFPEDAPRVFRDLEDHLQGKTPYLNSKYRMRADGDEWVWILDLGKVLEWDAKGKPLRAAGVHLDITELKNIELELRKEKERAQQYLDLAGVLFVALDTEGRVQMINRMGCQILGCAEDDVMGKKWVDHFVPQRYRQATQEVADELLTDRMDDGTNFINPVLTCSGEEAMIAWNNTTVHDEHGEIIGHLSSGTDITTQQAHERSLKQYQKRLQSLASQLATAEDSLRQEIAAGLHDSIGQNLAALKLSVDIMRLNLGVEVDGMKVPDLMSGLDSVSQTIDEIVKESWSLSFQLCPPGLQESGLVSALEWLISKFNVEHSSKVKMVVDGLPFETERSTRGVIFQMIRELMINAIKHGAAANVEIRLTRNARFVVASVKDDGKGFAVDEVMAAKDKSTGFGLFSIRERLAFISGKLDIESVVGKGTLVQIHFPLAQAPHAEDGGLS